MILALALVTIGVFLQFVTMGAADALLTRTLPGSRGEFFAWAILMLLVFASTSTLILAGAVWP